MGSRRIEDQIKSEGMELEEDSRFSDRWWLIHESLIEYCITSIDSQTTCGRADVPVASVPPGGGWSTDLPMNRSFPLNTPNRIFLLDLVYQKKAP